MAETVWRRRAPLWLRIVAGILILPILGIILFVATRLLGTDTPFVWLCAIAAALALLIAYRAPTPIAASLSVLAVLGLALPFYYGGEMERTFEDVGGHLDKAPDSHGLENEAGAPPPDQAAPSIEPPPLSLDEAPPRDGHHYEIPFDEFSSPLGGSDGVEQAAPSAPEAPARDPGTPSGGGGGSVAQSSMPEFPWPPPAASASYVLPDRLFTSYRTLGDVTEAILAALEQNGYVERSFFRTAPGGVALVTRLERINDDGSPSAENERWAAASQPLESTRSLLDLLQGLFFVDPGHYRVIVFVLQDLPFSQSAETITAQQAHAWLTSGANVLSPEIAALPFAGGHVTVLIYEFASDGSKVQVVTSQLTGKQHLEKAGLLTVLDKVQ
jgi:hypothetical protein